MEKESNLSDNLQSRLFALGPAPPGFRPPDATAFATAESNLRNAIRYLNDTYGELDQLRTVIQKEKNNSKRTSYKAQSMMLAMQVIRFKGLIGKYRDILIGLQDAEIIKVKQYIEQMVEMRNKIQAKTDPTQREFQVGSSISLVQEQRKTKRICRRWRDRLVQLTEAKMDKTEQLTEKPKLINKPRNMLNAKTNKWKEAVSLQQSGLIKSGCKRCEYLRKLTKNRPSKLCKVCKKWSDDEKAKAAGNKKANKTPIMAKSKKLEVRVRTDSEEAIIKIEIEHGEFTDEEEIGSLEKETTLKDEIKETVESHDTAAVEEENETSQDDVDPKVVASLQNSLKSIDCKNMALAYVKVLQEYAMLNDNYRAIGLLTEVEKSVLNPPQNEDFDL
uniref:CKII-alpha subunit interactor-3, isoform A n=1 Tax=Drosophila melanogaster TaxID=7227 RepID=Q9W0N3_DROME|eukprot:NP_001286890.1 CKII-alpha subunit interactor-3, isoform C [Drosophila melanogaster]